MRRYRNLSYVIEEGTPLYPGTPSILLEKKKAIAGGDGANTWFIGISNHTGTHIDGPLHFCEQAKEISDLDLKDFVFTKPAVGDCPKDPDGVIGIRDLESGLSDDRDLCIIKTGFARIRKSAPEIYSHRNPYLSTEAAEWIRNKRPNLRAIGVDCISIASHAHRDIGKEVHKTLLRPYGAAGRSVLIIEDMNIAQEIKKLDEVIVAPLLIKGLDSAPCIVIGAEND